MLSRLWEALQRLRPVRRAVRRRLFEAIEREAEEAGMLILTRKLDQSLMLYDDTGRYIGRVTVLGVERDRAKLGLDFSKRFTVLREEIADRREAQR